jgi:hypothetical protein
MCEVCDRDATIARLTAACRKAAAVLSGESTSKSGLVEALEAIRDAMKEPRS